MANKLPSTPTLPLAPQGSWEASYAALLKALYDMLVRDFYRTNLALPADGTEHMTGPLPLRSSTVAGLADWPAANYEGALLYISNEAGGKTIAFSDGTDWRRVQDRAVVS